MLKHVSMIASPHDRVTADAVLGTAGEPTHSLDDAFDIFEKKIRMAAPQMAAAETARPLQRQEGGR